VIYFIRFKKIIIAFILVQVIFIPKAYAYLDPGTGSYILQVIMAAVVGGLFITKLFWNKMKAFLNNIFDREKKGGKVRD
jgi:flagellar biosynthesis protein FliQ